MVCEASLSRALRVLPENFLENPKGQTWGCASAAQRLAAVAVSSPLWTAPGRPSGGLAPLREHGARWDWGVDGGSRFPGEAWAASVVKAHLFSKGGAQILFSFQG